MALLTFRSPQEGLDHFSKAVDIVNMLKEVITHPDNVGQIQNLAKEVAKAHQLTEAQKKELFAAQETMAQANEFREDFEAEKKAHSLKIQSDQAEIIKANQKLLEDTRSLANEKATLLETAKKQKAEADAKLAAAVAAHDAAKKIQEEAKKAQDAHACNLEQHSRTLAEFEKYKKANEDAFNSKLAAHEAEVKKLAADKAAFESRKKKFEAALRD